MKYYTDKTKQVEIDSHFRYFWTRHALRSHLREEDGKDMDYYNSIYAEVELEKFDTDLGNQIERGILSLTIGFWLGLFGLLFLSNMNTMFLMIGIAISFNIFENIKYIRRTNKKLKENTKNFNETKITINKDWAKPNSKGNYDLVWEPTESDEDPKHLEINQKEYEKLSKYWYELENFEGFPEDEWLFNTLFDKADWIRHVDIPVNAIMIR